MKVRILPVLFLVSLFGPVQAQINALPQARHILVYGHAEARAIPDRFKITISLDSVNDKADVAREMVEKNCQAVLAGLRTVPVADDQIIASSLKIEPKSHYDSDLGKRIFEGIEVSRDIKVSFSSQTGLESFLVKLDTSEEVQVSGIATELSDQAELEKQLRQKAIESSRKKAEAMAKAYGVGLAGIYSVSDVAPEFSYGIREGEWPELYEWNSRDGATTLGSVAVTGTRTESFSTGYVKFEDNIYAVFLISE